MLATITVILCSFISLKSYIIIHFVSKILYKVTVLRFQLREVSLKWCKEGWQVEVIFSVSIVLFRWECQSYLLINQLHELIEIIYSTCIKWNNVLSVGEMKATTQINKFHENLVTDHEEDPGRYRETTLWCLALFVNIHSLSETSSYSVLALHVNSTSFPSFKCWASFAMFDKSPLNNSHQSAKKTHVSCRKKSHGSSSTWTSAKIASYK